MSMVLVDKVKLEDFIQTICKRMSPSDPEGMAGASWRELNPIPADGLIEAAKAADKVLDFGGLYGEEWAMWLARLTKVACSVRKALREIEEAGNELPTLQNKVQ